MTHWEALHCPHCGCTLAEVTEGCTLSHPTSVACLGDILGDPAITLRCSNCGREASWWLCLPEGGSRRVVAGATYE